MTQTVKITLTAQDRREISDEVAQLKQRQDTLKYDLEREGEDWKDRKKGLEKGINSLDASISRLCRYLRDGYREEAAQTDMFSDGQDDKVA